MTVMGTNLELYCTALENVGSVVPEWILWWWCVTCDIFPLDLSVRPHLQLVGWGRSRSLGNTIKFQVKFQVDFSWFRVISRFQNKSVISLLWNHSAVWFQISLLWNHTAVWFQISLLWNHTLILKSNWNHPESTEINLKSAWINWNHAESNWNQT